MHLALDGKTGPDGMFRLADLEPGKRFDLTVQRSGYLPASVPGVPAPTTEPLRIELKTARGVSGRVVGPEAEPVPDAELDWVQESRIGGGSSAGSTSVGRTDPEGRFQAAGLPPGPVDLRVSAKGYAPRRLNGVQIPQDRDLDGFEIRLERGAVLQVRVLGPEGEPFPGASVHVEPMERKRRSGDEERWSFRGQRSLNRTDEEGLCSMELPEPGRYRVTVASQWRHLSLTVEAGPGISPVELRFPGGVAVSGRVTDGEGQGLPGVELLLRSAGGEVEGFGTASEADGSFTIENVTDGSYRLNASRQGYSPMEPRALEVAGLPASGIELRLEKKEEGRASIKGRILGLPPAEAARARIAAFSMGSGSSLQGKVEADGSYRVQSLEPGHWIVTALAPAGRQVQKEATIEAETSDIVLDFDLKGMTVSGRVLVDGAPLSGADVQGNSGSQSRTAYDGSFQLTVPAPGRYDLFIYAPFGTIGSVQSVEVEEKRELTIDIPTGGVSGRVVSAGAPLPDAVVAIQGILKIPPNEFSVPSVRSDGSGVFEVPRLAAGTYKLTVRKEGFSPAAETVEVRPGAAAPVEIALKPAP
jgi:protocatechuate 3,4-dioxygenase beta subunit